jgi:hypothetical protein
MFLCEFVKDLMHRLTGRDIYFRAVITYGDFSHYELNGIPCFFGNALVEAHNSEKELKAIGLFIRKDISQHCDIFRHRNFNERYDFVYVTQSLGEPDELGADGYPIPAELIWASGSEWEIYPEISHIAQMFAGSQNLGLQSDVRAKYAASWSMYCAEYPNLTSQLVRSANDVFSIAPDVDWQPVVDRHPEECGYAIETRVEF